MFETESKMLLNPKEALLFYITQSILPKV